MDNKLESLNFRALFSFKILEMSDFVMKNNNQFSRALSNSPLGVQTLVLFEISIDKFTIVGDLKSEEEKKLADTLAVHPAINLRNTGSSRFTAEIENVCYVEYDKFKGQTLNRRNMRVEFNPNNLTDSDQKLIYNLFVSKMKNKGFSRIDIAFDTDEDLSDYYAMTDTPMKTTNFYGLNGSVETKYFGTRRSDRYIRIYNKKQQLFDEFEKEIEQEHYWRVELELKHSWTEKWDNCVEDIYLLQPEWTMLENVSDQMKVYALMHEPNFWGKLSRNSKYKYKKIIKDISKIDLGNSLRKELKENKEKIFSELNFWLGDS